jgi:hypothetical protein
MDGTQLQAGPIVRNSEARNQTLIFRFELSGMAAIL